MGRQPFRQMKNDGTMEEAGSASGGGVFTTGLTDSTNTFLLVSENIWPLHSCPIFGSEYNSVLTSKSYDNSHLYISWWPFIAPKSGDISAINIAVGTATTTASDVLIGIYDSENGYINDLLGCAQFDSSVMASTGVKEQTSILSNHNGSSATITLVEGNKYFYCMKRDNGDNQTLFFNAVPNNYGYTIGKSNVNKHGSTGYFGYHNHNTELPASESNVGWVQHTSRNRMRCWIKM